MKYWSEKGKKNYYSDIEVRTGLRHKFDKDVDPEVKRACKEFCAWLRQSFYFPIRIPVYIKSSPTVKAQDGEQVTATCLQPLNRLSEPYIRVSAGDYRKMHESWGKDDALAAILHSIAHELTHYFQWVSGAELTEKQMEQSACNLATRIVNLYATTREHP